MKVERLAHKCGAFSFCIIYDNEKENISNTVCSECLLLRYGTLFKGRENLLCR